MGQLTRETFGPHLRQLRQQAGLSQRIAAKHAGVAEETWRRWEARGQAANIWRAPQIAYAIGSSMVDLLEPEPERIFVADLTISRDALERVRRLGEPELERVARQIADHARDKVATLASAKPQEQAQPRPASQRTVASQTRARMRRRAQARGYAYAPIRAPEADC